MFIQLLVAAAAPVTFRFANKLLCNQVNSSGKGPRAAKKEKKGELNRSCWAIPEMFDLAYPMMTVIYSRFSIKAYLLLFAV